MTKWWLEDTFFPNVCQLFLLLRKQLSPRALEAISTSHWQLTSLLLLSLPSVSSCYDPPPPLPPTFIIYHSRLPLCPLRLPSIDIPTPPHCCFVLFLLFSNPGARPLLSPSIHPSASFFISSCPLLDQLKVPLRLIRSSKLTRVSSSMQVCASRERSWVRVRKTEGRREVL